MTISQCQHKLAEVLQFNAIDIWGWGKKIDTEELHVYVDTLATIRDKYAIIG